MIAPGDIVSHADERLSCRTGRVLRSYGPGGMFLRVHRNDGKYSVWATENVRVLERPAARTVKPRRPRPKSRYGFSLGMKVRASDLSRAGDTGVVIGFLHRRPAVLVKWDGYDTPSGYFHEALEIVTSGQQSQD